MRIGILTFHWAQNYGAVLQCYALMNKLKELGHEVLIIDRLPKYQGIFRRLYHRFSYKYYLSWLKFSRFNKQWLIPKTKRYTTQHSLENFESNEKLDAVIVGSDQVWRWEIMGYNYFLDFIRKGNIRKYAYAASFGLSHWESQELELNQVKLLLKEFDAISVREQSGVSICNQVFGVPAQLVIDPTLLFDAYHYEAVFWREGPKDAGHKVVSYILGEKAMEQCMKISRWAESQGMDYRDLYWTRLGYPALTKGTNFFFHMTVEEWLDEIRNAAYVITNSFHCMVFAILFRKKFVVLDNVSGGSDRIRTLLGALQLKHRFIDSSDDFYQLKRILDDPIPYDEVEKRIHACRRDAVYFLENIK